MFDWLSRILQWLENLTWWENLLYWVPLFLCMFFGSIAVVAWILVRLPATYFQANHPPAFAWGEHYRLLRWAALVGKNLLGLLLIIVGIILSLPGIPGQGFLTILIGVMLLNFPGKRRLELKLVSRPRVLHAINRLRARFGKPPLVLDDQPTIRQVSESEKIKV